MGKKASTARRRSFGPLALLPVVLLVAAGYAIYTFGFGGPISVEGIVNDASTGAPLSGSRVTVRGGSASAPPRSISTGGDGTYAVKDVGRGSTVRAEAEGFEPQEFTAERTERRNIVLRPIEISGKVLDAFTNSPVSGASLSLADRSSNTGSDGTYRITAAKAGNALVVRAEGYAQATAGYTGQRSQDISLRPNTLYGTIKDAATGNPVKNARVSAVDKEAVSNEAGTYRLTELPQGLLKLTATASGYQKVTLDIKETTRQDVELVQFAARALYLTYYGVADQTLRESALDKIGKGELNAVVIDVKGDRGWVVYKTDVALAKRIGADNPTVKDFDSLIASLKKKNIYTIARIVVFKDHPLAMSRPDLAVIDTRTGKPWIDTENLAWVDPTRPEVWDYDLEIAREAARKGFDEIQFDYIRFPTDGSVTAARYSRPNTMENRLNAINGFLSRAKAELKPLGVAISVDVFGYTCWREDDMGIGQRIEEIGKHVDFISPMVYPSTYSDGIPDYRNAVAHPYEIVYYSLKRASERLAGLPVKLRPWLQYFDDYPWATGMMYNAREILAQRKAAADSRTSGWMMWDPTNKYARGGLSVD